MSTENTKTELEIAAGATKTVETPEAKPDPVATPLFEGDESWKNNLPEELRADPTIRITKNVSDLAKGYVHAVKKIGEKGIVKPGDSGTDEDWEKVYDYLGRPTLDKYDVKTKEGAKVDADFFKGFKEQAHKAGILPKQAQKLMDWHQAEVEKVEKAQAEAYVRTQKEAIEGLKKEWGNAYDAKMQTGITAIRGILGKDVANELFQDKSLGDNPKFIRLLAKLGEITAEDQDEGGTASRPGALTPGDAQKEINRVMADPGHPYNVATHPGHKDAIEELNKLFQQLQ